MRAMAHEAGKYLLVSIVALAVDYSLLVSLTRFGHLHYLVSAAIGFAAGLVVNYALSVAFVFQHRRVASRRLEFALFFGIGLLGLGLNEVLMKVFVEVVGLNFALAKIPATAVGFVWNFGLRRLTLFSASGQSAR